MRVPRTPLPVGSGPMRATSSGLIPKVTNSASAVLSSLSTPTAAYRAPVMEAASSITWRNRAGSSRSRSMSRTASRTRRSLVGSSIEW